MATIPTISRLSESVSNQAAKTALPSTIGMRPQTIASQYHRIGR
jgi:hypothetical protein